MLVQQVHTSKPSLYHPLDILRRLSLAIGPVMHEHCHTPTLQVRLEQSSRRTLERNNIA